jgi:pimeloyl-ACP methyl ester carboxylesterase
MAGFRQSIDEHERRETLAALRDLPVLVLAGGADRLTPLPHARAIAAELPAAELVIYPAAGHMLTYERDLDVAARLAGLVTSR